MKEEEKFGRGLPAGNRSPEYYNMATEGSGKTPRTIAALSRLSKKDKASFLLELFKDIHSATIEGKQAEAYKECWDAYSGRDEAFRDELTKFFGNTESIYPGMDLNALIKSIGNKLIQPYLAKDDVFTISPLGVDVETADRIAHLINSQVQAVDFRQEMFKVVKDGLIYGVSFLSVGWEEKTMIVPKRTLKKTVNQDKVGITGEDVVDAEIYSQDNEEITISNPDFKAEKLTNILMPACTRWKDVPYVIRKERVSRAVANERYELGLDEFGYTQKLKDEHYTEFDRIKDLIPGTDETVGEEALNEVELFHFYFRDGSYYVGMMTKFKDQGTKTRSSFEIVYEGMSPVPGMPIPIIPFIPDPVSDRIVGESLVNICKFEQRKMTELQNIMMRALRNQVNPIHLISANCDIPLERIANRVPGMPIVVEGEINPNSIFSFPLENMDNNLLNVQQMVYDNMQRITGQSDFAMGNIGKSARLSGVDSLIGMSMSRMTTYIAQFEEFLLNTADALILLNRAFLPLEYASIETSTGASMQEELMCIGYPLTIKIATSVAGSSDKSIVLGALREAIQMGFQLEAMSPGSIDIFGLVKKFFTEAGIKDIGRYFKKSVMTLAEARLLTMIDQTRNLEQNTNPGTPTSMSTGSTGMTQQDLMQQQGGGLDATGQAGQLPPLEETMGMGF